MLEQLPVLPSVRIKNEMYPVGKHHTNMCWEDMTETRVKLQRIPDDRQRNNRSRQR